MASNGSHSRPTSLVIASNRPPLTLEVGEDGERRLQVGSGGLAPAMWAAVQRTGATYVASASDAGDVPAAPPEPEVITTEHGPLHMVHIRPGDRRYNLYYNFLSNPFLWFVQHEMYPTEGERPSLEQIEHAWREGYLPVNEEFGRTIASTITDPGIQPVVMLQDYHLYRAALEIRRARSDAVITQFIHIPWPAPAVWTHPRYGVPPAILRGLMTGLAANDIVGFQTDTDRENFIDTCVTVMGGRRLSDGNGVRIFGRLLKVRTYPISIDVTDRTALLDSEAVKIERAALAQQYSPDETVHLFVGRGDFSKNLLRMLLGYDQMRRDHPERKDRFHVIANFTREDIPEYVEYRKQIDALVEEINRRYADPHRPERKPITLEWRKEDMAKAAAAMERADVIVAVSLADGMNLTVKDAAILNRRNGVVVLSETCGAFHELGIDCVTVANPRDVKEIARALYEAVTMPAAERKRRSSSMKAHIQSHPIELWNDRQGADIQAVITGRQTAGHGRVLAV